MLRILVRRGPVVWGMRIASGIITVLWTALYVFYIVAFIKTFRPLAVYQSVLWDPAKAAGLLTLVSTILEGSDVNRVAMLGIDLAALVTAVLGVGATATTFGLDFLAPWGCVTDIITLDMEQEILCTDRWVTLWMWFINIGAIVNSIVCVAIAASSIFATAGSPLKLFGVQRQLASRGASDIARVY